MKNLRSPPPQNPKKKKKKEIKARNVVKTNEKIKIYGLLNN